MSNLRFEAVSEASKRKPVEVTAPSERPSEFFGKKVFNRQKMYKYLPVQGVTFRCNMWMLLIVKLLSFKRYNYPFYKCRENE